MNPLPRPPQTLGDRLSDIRYHLLESSYKTETWIIILMLLLNFTLRIPTTPYPVGVDTYKTVWEVKKVVDSHKPVFETGAFSMRWGVFNIPFIIPHAMQRGPKVVYPFSDPFVYQLDYAILHQVTSLDLMNVMLLICLLSGVLSFLTSYVMARRFVENKLMVYLIAFSYSTAPTFLHASTWQGTFRVLFTAVFPMVLWSLFKYENSKRKKYLVYSLYFAFALLSIHRMGLFIPLLFFSYILVKAYLKVYSLIDGRNKRIDRLLSYLIPSIYVILTVVLLLFPFLSSVGFFKNMRYEYETGLLTEGLQAPRLLLNMTVDYYSSEGFLMVFAIVGFIVIVEKLRRPVKNINYLIVSATLLFYIPFMLQGEYMTVYMLPIFSILISLGVKGSLSFLELTASSLRLDYRVPWVFIVALIVLSCSFSIFMNYWWTVTPYFPQVPVPNWMDERVKQSVTYFDYVPGRVLIPEFTNLLTQFSATVSEYDKIWFGWENYGWSLHTNQNIVVIHYMNLTYAVEYTLYPGQWKNMGGDLGISPLLQDLYKERDRVYSNSLINLWDIEPDPGELDWVEEYLREHPEAGAWIAS